MPVKAYSSGMFLRLGFSIAAHLDADVMLIDEILAVGDESFQRKCLARISERMEAGATLVLVSHDPERDRARLPAGGGARRRPGGLRRRRWPTGCSSTTGCWARRGRRAQRAAGRAAARLEVAELELLRRRRPRRGACSARASRCGCGWRWRAGEPAERAVVALEVRDQRGELCFRTDTALAARSTRRGGVLRRCRGWRCWAATTTWRSAPHDQDAPAGGFARPRGRASRWRRARTARAWPTCAARGRWASRRGPHGEAAAREHARGRRRARRARAAERRRAEGGYARPPDAGALDAHDRRAARRRCELLSEWAVIEVDPDASSTPPAAAGRRSRRSSGCCCGCCASTSWSSRRARRASTSAARLGEELERAWRRSSADQRAGEE